MIAGQDLHQRILDPRGIGNTVRLPSCCRIATTTTTATVSHTTTRALIGTAGGHPGAQITGNATTGRRRRTVVVGILLRSQYISMYQTAGIVDRANSTARFGRTVTNSGKEKIRGCMAVVASSSHEEKNRRNEEIAVMEMTKLEEDEAEPLRAITAGYASSEIRPAQIDTLLPTSRPQVLMRPILR